MPYCPQWIRRRGATIPGMAYRRSAPRKRSAHLTLLLNWIGWHSGWYHLKWWWNLLTFHSKWEPAAWHRWKEPE